MTDSRSRGRWRRAGIAAAATTLTIGLGGVVAGCGSSSDTTGGGSSGAAARSTWSATRLPETVYEEGLEPGFNKTSAGAGVSFSNSFGASGDQSRAVEAGQPASLVHFSQAGDMSRLVDAGNRR